MYTFPITASLTLLLATLLLTITALPLPSPDLMPPGIEPKPVSSPLYTFAEHGTDFPPRSIDPIIEPHIPIVSQYPPTTPDNAPPSSSLSRRDKLPPGHNRWPATKQNPWAMSNFGNTPRPYGMPPDVSFPLATGPGPDSPPKSKRDGQPQPTGRPWWKRWNPRRTHHLSPPDINGCVWWMMCPRPAPPTL